MRLIVFAILACGLSMAQQPTGVYSPKDSGSILTPKPGPAPSINGPGMYGVRPGHPFLYRIPCTGERPIRFSAKNLPGSLTLDGATGIITGRAPEKAGEYVITLQAKNARGTAKRTLKIAAGDTIALTPPMGWNHWYTHYSRITDKLVRQAADAMVESGMADYGYQYVSIDDCWMIKPGSTNPLLMGEPRDDGGAVRPNQNFPDMKALTDYIHSKGLKAGTYTSPGPLTCASYVGAYEHEEADARKFAEWGFDLLKYDWCSYGKMATDKSQGELQKPYKKMGAILKGLDRDIVLNLCQYGMGDVWKWGAEVGGHSWRTTGDLGLEKDTHLPGFYLIGLKNAEHYEFAGPGAWNDPDYILIGQIGNAFRMSDPPQQTRLTPDEQYSYMSMWSLMASPLFFSGDMRHLDAFTLNVLCNAEVIAVNQDALGKQARIVRRSGEEFVLAKPMEDGPVAVGLFNLGESSRTVTVGWQELGLKGRVKARDLWRQQDAGTYSNAFSATVPRHGVIMVRLSSGR
ncbi:MAG: putative Ig domain-containing protein [Bryobacteraceae bacterium]